MSFFHPILYTRSENILFPKQTVHPQFFFFLELGKLLYARVSKFGFLGDTCARLIMGCDVKGKAIWTNLIVAVSICGRCYFVNF